MIVVDDLHKEFKVAQSKGWQRWLQRGQVKTGAVKAVDGISFIAQDGAITGLLGANGAGKTTSLRMIASLLAADSGQILVDKALVKPGQPNSLSQLGILSDARGLYPRLTARENISYYGILHGMTREAANVRADQLAHWLEMTPLLDRRTDGFSQGERMKTALARALVHDPKNIILDEPTNGLDVLATRGLREFLRWLRSAEGGGKCIIFSTHIMQEVEKLCDHVIVVSRGKTVTQGSVNQLLEQAGETDFENAFVKLAFAQQEGVMS